jgi:uncharacterized RDD family membrane protein YckC
VAIGRRDVGGWLDGPQLPSSGASRYPGERLGRPQTGPGSVGRFGRRLVGVAVDWGFSLLIATGLLRPLGWGSFAPLAGFLTIHVLLVGTAGFTPGHGVVGLRVARLDGGLPGPVRSLVRSVLLCLVIPAFVWDADQRGLHDKAAGTIVVRREPPRSRPAPQA